MRTSDGNHSQMPATPGAAIEDARVFRADTMATALAEVKRALGPDAVIHRTRTFRAGAVLGFGGRQVVEITASIAPPRHAAPARPSGVLSADERRTRARAAGGPAEFAAPVRPGPSASVEPAAVPAEPKPSLREPKPAPAPAASGPDALLPAPRASSLIATPVRLAPQTPEAASDLEAELGTIKRMLGQVLRASSRGGTDPVSGLPAPAAALCRGLVDAETPPDVAAEVARGVADQLTEHELSDRGILTATATRLLGERFRTVGPAPRSAADANRARRVALVGPTGVGKTTTIAKLAATAALRHGRRVGLITADTYRIAAVEQLRTYATIIGLPLEVVQTPEEMSAAVAALEGCDVVFIDTAGRSHRDGERLEELARVLGAAAPDEVHLVLSASSSPPVWRAAAERFGRTIVGSGRGVRAIDRAILTKLDECAAPGCLAAFEDIVGLPLSYVTDGQDVPDHIEPARAERLAGVVVESAMELCGSPAEAVRG